MADEFFLDPRAVRRSFDRASRTYDAAAAVQAEIRTRLLERLDIVRLQPTACSTSARAPATRAAISSAATRPRRSSPWIPRCRCCGQSARAAALPAPLCSASAPTRTACRCEASRSTWCCSNLLLEWCHDPDAVFAEAARVLRPRGLFTFTTVGPDTLKEVRELWRGIDPFTHVHRFIDMHDFGDALMRAGFAEPVMDTERLTVTYSDLSALRRRDPRQRRAQHRAGPAARAHRSRARRRRAIAERRARQERPVADQR